MTIRGNITDHSVSFFAKGRPWTVPSDHANFAEIRGLMQASWNGEEVDIDALVNLSDIRVGIVEASAGTLEFIGNEMVYAGQALHNVWVDKILKFKDAGQPFAPIFNALSDLLTNPTPAAIERLPIFVERSQLGFLPDGRITGFKKVQSDFMSGHSGPNGKVSWAIGEKPTMDRNLVDADPDRSCSTGLHVGALDYVKDFGCGRGDRIVLVAVWPRDFVAVPKDYNGSKARVCAAEVLEELDKAFVDEFLAQNQTVVRGYSEPETEDEDLGIEDEEEADELPTGPAYEAKVGDWVRFHDDRYGLVEEIDENDAWNRLRLRGVDWIGDDVVNEIVPLDQVPVWIRADEGDQVVIEAEPILRDGTYRVATIDDESQTAPEEKRLTVGTAAGDLLVLNSAIKSIVGEQLPKNTAYLDARVGDRVKVWGSTIVGDGEHEVAQVCENDPLNMRLRLASGIAGVSYSVEDLAVKQVILQVDPVYQTPAHERAQVGDSVKVEGSYHTPDGVYEVAFIDTIPNVQCRLQVSLPDGNLRWVANAAIMDVYPRP